ncbi:MAG: SDR family oxidoreductase [Candidatus Latescibacterota bacterium]|nr:MAG: SDR family oxidoreductase [Candidatus Latescibacterota bacterium]
MTKHYLIVGASSGIGKAIRERLVADGNQVVCVSRTSSPAVDVTLEEPAFPAVEGPIHGLVYCPGSIQLRPFASLSVENFRRDLELNFIGGVRALQNYLPGLQAEGASVVLFSTVAVRIGMPMHTSVAAAKGAVEGFARSLAAELAPRVRVNVLAPSLTDTPLAARLLRTDRQREAAAKRHPMARFGQPADFADAACFLLSPGSAWMTGQVVHVDGGLSTLRPL